MNYGELKRITRDDKGPVSDFFDDIKAIPESERKIIELKHHAFSMILKHGIISGFGDLASKIREECSHQFDNKLLHNVASELYYEGKIEILKIVRGKPYFYHEDIEVKGRGNRYVYFFRSEDNWIYIWTLFPGLKNRITFQIKTKHLKCPICKKRVNPVKTPEGEYVCPKDGYVFTRNELPRVF